MSTETPVAILSGALPIGKDSARRTLGADLRASIPDAVAAAALAGIVFAVYVFRVRSGVDAAALEMPDMVKNGSVWPYSLSQAAGWAALVWSWMTILLGVSQPLCSAAQRPQLRSTFERLHRTTSLTLIVLMTTHAMALLWDQMGDTLITIFVPLTTSYAPGRFPEALGIISLYVSVLLGMSFYIRGTFGPRKWRLLHRYLIPAVYILAVWHTFAYGSDLHKHNALWVALWVLQMPIVAAFSLRLLGALKQRRPVIVTPGEA